MRLAAWFCLAVGALIPLQWGFFLATGQVPELRTAPVQIALHLAAEACTSALLLAAGAGALRRRPWAHPAALVGLGMLCYTVIQSPGYFAARGAWPAVAMFAALLAGAVASAVRLARG